MAENMFKIERYFDNNKNFAETYKTPPTMKDMRALVLSIGGGSIILTCADPRCVPEDFFGPNLGAPVLRNAGGRANKDAITCITALRSLAGVRTVLVVHHTDCGMTHMSEDGIRSEAKARTPDAASEIDAIETFGCFSEEDFDQAVRDDVETLKQAKVLGGVEIRGFKLVIETGIVTELDV